MYVAPSFTFSVNSPGSQQRASYLDATIIDSANSAFASGSLLDAWCMDISVSINPGQPYTGYIYSSYETGVLNDALPIYAALTGNLDNINWLLNYYDGSNGQYNWGEVQSAIWTLMGQDYTSQSAQTQSGGPVLDTDVDALVSEALAHDGFVPDAGERLAVIIDPVSADGKHGQPLFCEVKAASLGDRVWEDNNANGLQDTNERGIANAKVELVRDLDGNGLIGSNEVLASTTTDANGNYRFDGLTPGLQYQVQFTQPAGYRAASPRQADGSVGSNTNSDGLLSDVVTLAPGEHNPTLDAGFVPPPCAKLIGTTSMNENSQAVYYVQLDQVLDHDVSFTVKTADVTANRVDQYAANQQIMWGGYYTDASGKHYVNPNGGYIPLGTGAGQGWVKAFGPNGNDSWDYSLYHDADVIASGGTTTVTIKAGQTTSESVYVWAWNEKVHVDGNAGNSAGYYEGTEQFSLSITGSSDNCLDICKPSVITDICDTTSYHHFSPIALDLDGNGIQTTAIGQTTGKFDLLGDGTDVTTGWLSAGDAFLAVDASGNGSIDGVQELFGGNKGDGFAKLASFDSNGDGVVNAADARFAELLVWQDLNSNHQSDAGELRSLAEAGIASLNVAYTDQEFTDAVGNVHGETSVATRADGSSIAMVDVYLNYVETKDFLDSGSLDTLVGAGSASSTSVQAEVADFGDMTMVAELLRKIADMQVTAAMPA